MMTEQNTMLEQHSDDDRRPFNRATIDLQDSPAPQGEKKVIRTLPDLVEYNATYNAQYPFCIQVKAIQRGLNGHSANFDGIQTITISHSQLRGSIQHCLLHLKNSVEELELPVRENDGSIRKGAPVALLMESDVGLLIYKLSLMSLGVPVLLLSARLSSTAIHHLLSKTGARAIIVSPRLERSAREALNIFSVENTNPCSLYSQASYDTFLSHPQTVMDGSICTQGHYIGELDRDVVILHSSGTTGLPKPIYTSHKQMLSYAACHNFGSHEEAQGLSLSTLPLFHGFGLITPYLSLGIGMKFCIGPPSIIPTGSSIVHMLKETGARSLMSVPSILEDISLLPDDVGVAALSRLQFVAFGGGLLKPRVGEKLAAAGVKLLNHYGTTESGPLALIFTPGDDYDWRYFRLRTDIKLVLEANGVSDGVERFSLTAFPFGWQTGFRIQDQLISNPQNPTSDFSAIGRTDDLILLATGEKVLPNILETLLSENEHVKVAIAFGDGQFEIGVIVVPSSPVPSDQCDEFKSLIWPTILEAGNRMDGQAQVSSKAAIVIVPDSTVFPRSDKGSILRKEVYHAFAEEIASAYRDLENNLSENYEGLLHAETLEQDVKNFIQNRFKWRIPAEEWTSNDDFFELGMDSLQAVRLHRLLLATVPILTKRSSATNLISRDFVYQYSSVSKLASALRTLLDVPDRLLPGGSRIDEFVDLYSLQAIPSTSDELTVLITGSTGSLGVHVLAQFACLPNVKRLICLNRPGAPGTSTLDGSDRHLKLLKLKNITLSKSDWGKIDFVECNTGSPFLGLSEAKYIEISSSITHIVHNAWPMDFRRRLSSFETQFKTLKNLLELGRKAHLTQSNCKCRLVFVSSVAVVGQYPCVQKEVIVPEIPVSNAAWANEIGYAEAKLVCEKMLENAARQFPRQIEVSSVRVGQMSGSSKNGNWNTSEHLAALIKSSQLIKCFPKLRGTFAWIPVDLAAASLSEIVLSATPLRSTYHLENPIRQSWQETLGIIASELEVPMSNSVEFEAWLAEVGKVPDKFADQNPASKLMDFFEKEFVHMACGNVILDTGRSREISPSLRALRAVDKNLLLSYVRHWRDVGFLS